MRGCYRLLVLLILAIVQYGPAYAQPKPAKAALDVANAFVKFANPQSRADVCKWIDDNPAAPLNESELKGLLEKRDRNEYSDIMVYAAAKNACASHALLISGNCSATSLLNVDQIAAVIGTINSIGDRKEIGIGLACVTIPATLSISAGLGRNLKFIYLKNVVIAPEGAMLDLFDNPPTLQIKNIETTGSIEIIGSHIESIEISGARIGGNIAIYDLVGTSLNIQNSTIGNSILIGEVDLGQIAEETGIGSGFLKLNNLNVERNVIIGYGANDNDRLGIGKARTKGGVNVAGRFFVAETSAGAELAAYNFHVTGIDFSPLFGLLKARSIRLNDSSFVPAKIDTVEQLRFRSYQLTAELIDFSGIDFGLAITADGWRAKDIFLTSITASKTFWLNQLTASGFEISRSKLADVNIDGGKIGYGIVGWSTLENTNLFGCEIGSLTVTFDSNVKNFSVRNSVFSNQFTLGHVVVREKIDLSGSEFKNGLYFVGRDAKGVFRSPTWQNKAVLLLAGTRTPVLYANRDSLSYHETGEPVRTVLTGVEFGTIASVFEQLDSAPDSFAARSVDDILLWLKSGQARFDAHPYSVFAKALQRSGNNGKASEILLERTARANWEDGSLAGRLKYLIGWPIAWGYKIENAVIISLAFLALGSWISSYYQLFPSIPAPPNEKESRARDIRVLRSNQSKALSWKSLALKFALVLMICCVLYTAVNLVRPGDALIAIFGTVLTLLVLALLLYRKKVAHELRSHWRQALAALGAISFHDVFFSLDRYLPTPGFHSYWGNYPRIGQAGRNYFYVHRLIGAIVIGISVAGVTGLFE